MLVMCGCFYFRNLYNTSMEKTHTINTLEELALFAEQFLNEISKSEVSGSVVVGITGDLGAGKTNCAHCVWLKLCSNQRPLFVLSGPREFMRLCQRTLIFYPSPRLT